MIQYSFIIPHRNSPQILRRLLDSIPQREDVQVIVVDDVEGRGGGWARNQGLRCAQGRWLLFADADDFYADGFLDVLDSYCDREDLDVLYFGFQMVNEATGEVEPTATASFLQGYDGTRPAENLVRFKINSPWCKMVRRDFAVQHDLCFEETRIANDLFFSLTVGYFAQRIAVDKRVLYNYVHYPSSQTNRSWNRAKLFDYLAVNLRANAFYRHTGHPELCRRLPNLWLEALRSGGWHRFFQMSWCFIADGCRLWRTSNLYINKICTNSPSASKAV